MHRDDTASGTLLQARYSGSLSEAVIVVDLPPMRRLPCGGPVPSESGVGGSATCEHDLPPHSKTQATSYESSGLWQPRFRQSNADTLKGGHRTLTPRVI